MRTDKWTDKIDTITKDFKETFGKLSNEQLCWKPNEQAWSIAQNIEHLIILNQSYYPAINAIHQGTYKAPFMGKIGFMVNFMGQKILNSVDPDRRRKTKTFSIWEPVQGEINIDVLKKFEEHQNDLKQQIISCQDLLDKRTVISSPVNKNIVYKLETAFDIITTHEQRHFEQAKEVLAKQKRNYQ